jgi:transposase
MPRFKHNDVEYGQGHFVTINYHEQLLPGTFEYMLDDLIGYKIDTGAFQTKYKNDETGASAIHPDALIKLILYGYSRGCKSSRTIWELSRHNIIAKALTNDTAMHWTSIADFISSNSEILKRIFVEVLAYCNELDLIGGATFAIDGLRLPSNASRQLTGTEAELQKRLEVYKKIASRHIERHKRKDEAGEVDEEDERRYENRQKVLNQTIDKISNFLENMEKKFGKDGQELRSNVTDNESGLIKSDEGFIQGYIGIAAADAKNQIIVAADVQGSSYEGGVFPGMLDEAVANIEEAGGAVKENAAILADNNYYSEENLTAAQERGIEPIMPDKQYRKRLGGKGGEYYETKDFIYHEDEDYYECPCGQRLTYYRDRNLHGNPGKEYRAQGAICRTCPNLSKCLRRKSKGKKLTTGRTLLITASNKVGSLCGRMIDKMNTEKYQEIYSKRLGIIEPVFSDIGYCKGFNRFTLRSKKKVGGQWLLCCMVHNLWKCLTEYNKSLGFA